MNQKIDSFSGEYRFLSNFWSVNVSFEGKTYPSSEHAYQAPKTTDESIREKIRQMETAGKAKKLGQQIEKRSDWNDDMRIANMTALVEEKFSIKNDELVQKLLATGDAELIEGNTWNDTFFGVCNGVGENHLGKILMATRQKLNLQRNAIVAALTKNKRRKLAADELEISERTLYRLIKVFDIQE